VERTIAAVFAHPDDETFATGGTLAKYASEGARIVLYCATDGSAGKTSGIPVSSAEELGRLRRQEVEAACSVLGVEWPRFGGHQDGALAQAGDERVIGEIVDFLQAERPDVVITFGPEGAPTQHRDHKAICALATRACEIEAPPRLCYVTWQQPIADIYGCTGQPIDITIDVRPWLGKKREAFHAHASQRQHETAFEKGGMTDDECFHVASGVPAPAGATDLFAGL
jgi:LmbE family N-acetylglucosaminyl deacetylase